MFFLALDNAVDVEGFIQGEAEPREVAQEEHGDRADEDGGGGQTELLLLPCPLAWVVGSLQRILSKL